MLCVTYILPDYLPANFEVHEKRKGNPWKQPAQQPKYIIYWNNYHLHFKIKQHKSVINYSSTYVFLFANISTVKWYNSYSWIQQITGENRYILYIEKVFLYFLANATDSYKILRYILRHTLFHKYMYFEYNFCMPNHFYAPLNWICFKIFQTISMPSSQYVIPWFQCIADPGIRYFWPFLTKQLMPVIDRCQAHSEGLGRDGG